MTPERWRHIEWLYHAALERDTGERATFLAEACDGDEALRGEVESLLRCDTRAERFIEAPALEVAAQLCAKVLDFGLARITDEDGAGASGLSQAGQIRGTLPYMSPEQVRGDHDQIDVRADVYALGVILYELLTERLPYDFEHVTTPQAIRIICEEAPKPLNRAWGESRSHGAGSVGPRQAVRWSSGFSGTGTTVELQRRALPLVVRPTPHPTVLTTDRLGVSRLLGNGARLRYG
jgi:serine/threonine protein kinase